MKTQIIFLVFVFLFTVQFVLAGTTGKITGTVTDAETGEGLPGANVIIEGTTMGAATDFEGYYVILNVPPGVYSIKASMMGYDAMKVENIKVSIDFTTKGDFPLPPTVLEIGKEITVIAERPLIRKDLTSTLSTVGDEEIRGMPVEEFEQVLELQAGIVEGSDGKTHIRGGRASEIGYLIDGISVTDPFSGDIAIEVENTGIQELQVISGTFNAEYGQAMSGIVDIVTKSGGNELTGELSAYSGDYMSNHTETFLNIDDFKPLSISNLQGTLSGPVTGFKDKLFFYATGRVYDNDGWLYGIRRFNPKDSSNFGHVEPAKWYIEETGDGAKVPMNPYKKLSTQGKLTWRISPSLRLSYGILWDKVDFQEYDHSFKLNPDGNYHQYKKGYTQNLIWNHTLSPKTFYTVKFSNMFFDYRYYVYEDPFDSRYADPKRLIDARQNAFKTGGTQMWHQKRSTTTFTGKFDITSQVTKIHQIKMGVEAKRYRLWLHEFEIIPKRDETGVEIRPFVPDILPIISYNHNDYLHHPIEASAYLQDKLELKDMIVNVGFRYDFFEPDREVPVKEYYITTTEGERVRREGDRDPTNAPKRKAKQTHQFSPRVGIAYPITDRGVIHFSYGHFFQTPPFEYLYHNPEFEVLTGRLSSKMGNAELKPQKTVIYEIGLQQQLADNIGVDVTGFYKDIRNLLGTEVHELYIMGDKYAKYVNRDYGNVRGFTVALDMRRTRYLSAAIDYTYQVAEGNASDPDAAFQDVRSVPPRESEIQVVSLDWDQTHTLNISVILSQPGSWGLSILGRMGSGLPYTSSYQGVRTSFENSERKPPQYTFDLRAHKVFKIGGLEYSIFLKVYNLFDLKNEIKIYSDTGRAGYTLAYRYAGMVRGVNTLEEYFNRPDYYSEPRRVILGMSLGF